MLSFPHWPHASVFAIRTQWLWGRVRLRFAGEQIEAGWGCAESFLDDSFDAGRWNSIRTVFPLSWTLGSFLGLSFPKSFDLMRWQKPLSNLPIGIWFISTPREKSSFHGHFKWHNFHVHLLLSAIWMHPCSPAKWGRLLGFRLRGEQPNLGK